MSRHNASNANDLIKALAAWLGVLLVAFVTGCATQERRADIPFGTWSGEGVFVCEYWEKKNKDSKESEPSSSTGRYQTRLTIRQTELDGREVVEILSDSDHSGIPDMDEGSHLKIALEPAKRVSDSMVLYRQVGFRFNAAPGNKLRYKEDGPPFSASCMTAGGETLLEVQYMENFVDIFRFDGRRLEKSGLFFDPEAGMIHWTEQLTKEK